MKRRTLKPLAVLTLLIFLNQLLFPGIASALSSGPSQPEMQGFQPVGATDMVNLFTGDFSYGIPIMDVGGYPLNLSYQAGISPEQEASWVGLGWNLHPGSINRSMRGLPDDFDGDEVVTTTSMKPHVTWGVSGILGFEFPAKEWVNSVLSIGYSRNNYTGASFSLSYGPEFNGSKINGPENCFGLGVSVSSNNGISLNPSFNMNGVDRDGGGHVFTSGLQYNSRKGLMDVSFARHTSVRSLGLSRNTYFPYATHPRMSAESDLTFKNGVEAFAAFAHAGMRGSISTSTIFNKEMKYKAYGYQNLQNHLLNNKSHNVAGDQFLLDFNREKQSIFVDKLENLPVTQLTYDAYQINAHGFSGSFRPHRSDIGTVYDPIVRNYDGSGSGGTDFGTGNTLKGGVSINLKATLSESGAWKNNTITDNYSFKASGEVEDETGNASFQPFYFKANGDWLGTTTAEMTEYDHDAPVRPIAKSWFTSTGGKTHYLDDKLMGKYGEIDMASVSQYNEDVPLKTTHIHHLNALQASRLALDKKLRNYTAEGELSYTELERYDYGNTDDIETRKEHHLSEMSITRADGSKYVFGTPVYNLKTKEVTFSTDEDKPTTTNKNEGTIHYDASHASKENDQGNDHFYQERIIPAYASSYLLSAVLSPDYVDVTGDGISSDDLGSATQFNYQKLKFEGGADGHKYKWRTPFDPYGSGDHPDHYAKLNEGLKAHPNDQKANFVYGEREVWLPHSVESKNFIAFFHTSAREDALGVENEDGGLDKDRRLRKLDKIELFSKEEIAKNGSNASPIKTAHFSYTYELCKQTPNNSTDQVTGNDNHGKLTLTGVWFTYGNSTRGELSKYKFTYKTSGDIEYLPNRVDRWGTMQKRDLPTNTDWNSDDYKRQDEYPYTKQGNIYFDEWSLAQIDLPSGGVINVNYEADDYAYVQDRKAMRLFDIVETGYLDDNGSLQTDGLSSGNHLNLYKKDANGNHLNFNCMVFDLDDNINAPDQASAGWEIEKKYGLEEKDEKIYFRVFSEVRDGEPEREFVSGYAEVEGYGAYQSVPGNSYDMGYVRLKKVRLNDKEAKKDKTYKEKNLANPIAMACWRHYRKNLSHLVFPGSEPKNSDRTALYGLLAAFGNDFMNMIAGFFRHMRNKEFAKYIIDEKSQIRLVDPDKCKKGGGLRVKQITISDGWKDMIDGDEDKLTNTYGQVYDYTARDADGNVDGSSGVASNEPFIGRDENSVIRFKSQTEIKNLLAVNDRISYEWPYGEMFLPAPVVGYSRVEVKNYNPTTDDAGWADSRVVKRTATGKSVYEYYTAREFPVIFKETTVDIKRHKPPFVLKYFMMNVEDKVLLTQGYSIATNDMHGKPKANYIFSESDTKNPIAYSKTHYRFTEENRANYKSNAKIPNSYLTNTWNKVGSQGSVSAGIDRDMVFDVVRSVSNSKTYNGDGNLDYFQIGPIPVPLVLFFPPVRKLKTEFKSATLTKVIHRKGIVNYTESKDRGVSSRATPVTYDAHTGSLLMSKTPNAFNKETFSTSFPAYWAYPHMGHKSERYLKHYTNISFNGTTDKLEDGQGNALTGLKDGDKVILEEREPIDFNALDKLSANAYAAIMSYANHVREEFGRKYTTLNTPEVVRGEMRPYYYVHDGRLIDAKGEVRTFVPSPNTELCMRIIEPAETNQLAAGIGSMVTVGLPDIDDLKTASVTTGIDVLSANAVEYADDWKTQCCGMVLTKNNYLKPTEDRKCATINPYLRGLKNQYRVKRNWGVYTQRTATAQTNSHGHPDIVNDGAYESFKPFWEYSNGTWNIIANPETQNWNWLQEITEYHPNGIELENTNRLNVPSAVQYGYDNQVLLAVAANAAYTDMGYDGFEDYDYKRVNASTNTALTNHYFYPPHFGFKSLSKSYFTYRSSEDKHTGKYSLKVPNSTELSMSFNLKDDQQTQVYSPEYELNPDNCIKQFKPTANDASPKTYYLSTWMKEGSAPVVSNYTQGRMKVSFVTEANTVFAPSAVDPTASDYFLPSGPIIDGWQRIQGTFVVPENDPANASDPVVEIRIGYEALADDVYFDDTRVHPDKGTMTSYVYHPESLRLLATLDENNYAAFYEYDGEGNLVRTKRETERGIVTLQENRQHIRSSN